MVDVVWCVGADADVLKGRVEGWAARIRGVYSGRHTVFLLLVVFSRGHFIHTLKRRVDRATYSWLPFAWLRSTTKTC